MNIDCEGFVFISLLWIHGIAILSYTAVISLQMKHAKKLFLLLFFWRLHVTVCTKHFFFQSFSYLLRISPVHLLLSSQKKIIVGFPFLHVQRTINIHIALNLFPPTKKHKILST